VVPAGTPSSASPAKAKGKAAVATPAAPKPTKRGR
jgi:hypothetical protein